MRHPSGVQPNSSQESPARSSYSIFPRSTSRSWSEKSLTMLSPCFSALIRRDLRCRLMNQYERRPATVKGTNDLMPVTAYRDLDKLGLLESVTTLNLHPHLPQYEVTTTDTNSIRLLARQPINLERPHPFVEEGNKEFNCFLWMPSADERPGDIVLADSTIFTTLFGVSDSLKNFWRNLATMRMG